LNRFFADEYYETKIPALRGILRAWIDVQRDYSKAVVGDYSWNYRERTCIGFLAGAVWRSGGVALEEWLTKKGSKVEQQRGRCDLWIYRRDRYDFHIEAKHMWSRATGKRSSELGYIERELSRAVADSNRLSCPRKLRLGLLFIAPFYPIGKQREMSDHMANWLKDIYSIPHSAIAWCFRDRRTLRAGRWQVGPGIVLLARRPKTDSPTKNVSS
jgi:hypothetical protein